VCQHFVYQFFIYCILYLIGYIINFNLYFISQLHLLSLVADKKMLKISYICHLTCVIIFFFLSFYRFNWNCHANPICRSQLQIQRYLLPPSVVMQCTINMHKSAGSAINMNWPTAEKQIEQTTLKFPLRIATGAMTTFLYPTPEKSYPDSPWQKHVHMGAMLMQKNNVGDFLSGNSATTLT